MGALSLWQLLAVAWRRWYLLLFVLLVSAALGAGTYEKIAPTYSDSAELLLLPTPASAGAGVGPDPSPGNPFLALSVGLAQTGSIIGVATMDEHAVAKLAARGLSGTYTISENVALNAPVVDIVTSASTPEAAARDRQLVVAEFEAQLESAQLAAGAPKNTLITATLLSQAKYPVAVNKSRIRDGIAVGAAALVVGLAGIGWVEARARRTVPKRPARPAGRDFPDSFDRSGDRDEASRGQLTESAVGNTNS